MAKTPQNSAPRARGTRAATAKSGAAKTSTAKAARAKTTSSAKPTRAATKAAAGKTTAARASHTKLTPKPQTIDLGPKDVRSGKAENALPAGDALKVVEEARTRSTRNSDTPSSPPPKKGFGILAIILAGATGAALTVLAGLAVLGSELFRTDTTALENQLAKLEGQVQSVSGQLNDVLGQVDTLESADPINLPPDLSEPLSDITGTLAQLQAKLAENVATNTNRSETTNENFDALNQDVSELTQSLNAQLGELDAIFDKRTAIVDERMSAATSRSDDLANRQVAMEASITSGQAGDGPALAVLEAKLGNLANTQSRLQAQLQAQLQARLEERLDATSSANGQPMDIAPLADAFAALKQSVLKLDELTSALAKQGTDLAKLTEKTDALESDLQQQANNVPAATAQSTAINGAVYAYLHDSLSSALDSGVPFAALLQQAQVLFPEALSYAELESSAESGIMPLSDLADELAAASTDIAIIFAKSQPSAKADLPPKSFLDSVKDSLGNLVTVRELEAPDPSSMRPILQLFSEAEAFVRAGDTANASRIMLAISKLDGVADLKTGESGRPVPESLQIWMSQLSDHASLQALLAKIEKTQQHIWANGLEGAKP
ncbi:MAG: hypothetical protein JKY99_09110 [Rhizobiales bacterium]|nr:hypothetical protein [Hyphomicrobiales bacterium]